MRVRIRHAVGALAGLCLAVAACHTGGVSPQEETIELTTPASDAAVYEGMRMTATDFGGTGVPETGTRSWHSGAIPFGTTSPQWARYGRLPAGTMVVTAQIADTTNDMRRVLFHCSLTVGVELKPQELGDLTRVALLAFVRQVRRHLAAG